MVMIKLLDILNEALNEQEIVSIAKEFMNSDSYNSNHDCKRSTFEFINWLKKNKGFEPNVLLLAPPKDIKKFPGKSKDGDSHIFAIIDGYGVDFTANQFPGISKPLKITSENQIPSEYKKIGGYYTLYPDWFENGKTAIKTKFNNLPQWFRDGFEKEGFKPDLNESIDKTAGVWDTDEKFKDGSDFKIKFKVSDVIDLTKNTPVKEIDPKSIKYNFSGRQDSDPSKTKERVMKADLSYPIIAVQNENGKIFAMLDGTHRLEKALNLGLDKIKTKVLDKEDLIQFKTDKLKESIKLIDILNEVDPKTGTGKKPKGSGRRLYTDENPKDTVSIKFKTAQDIKDTLSKTSFKSKKHARKSQIINLIHQRVRAAYGKAKDPEVKARLKKGLEYITAKKEASKEKTERLRKMKEASDPQAGTAIPYGSGFAPVKEYGNTGSSTPKVYIVKADGTYKEVPIGILSKIPNLTYDMGGGETNYYPEKNIVIVDNIPVEQFAKEPGEIKDEKIYVEYNLNQPFSFPKANKILAAQVVYHLGDIKSFAKTINDSLKDGGTFQFFSDLMNKQDKEFLNYLSSEYRFGLPKNLNPYRGENIFLKKGDYTEPVISHIYLVTDAGGNTAKVSVTKEGRWWEYAKIEGDIDFKPSQWSVEPEYKYNDIIPSKENVLDSFSKALGTDIVDFKKLKENLDPKTFKDKKSAIPHGSGYTLAQQNEDLLTEKCWKGYTQKGMKKMFGKKYPNCVKK